MATTHQMVAHLWANKSRNSAKGFNLYFDGDTIFSYGSHFPIARHVTMPNGTAAVLFTTQSYSVSTSKHISYTRRALRGDVPVYYVKNPLSSDWRAHFEGYRAYFESMLVSASRARINKTMYLENAQRTVDRANAFAKATKLRSRLKWSDDWQTTLEAARKRDDAARRKQAEIEAERRAAEDARTQERLDAWLSGADVNPPYRDQVYMRVVGDTLQTNKGARVPLADAMRIFRFAAHCRQHGIRLERPQMAPGESNVGAFNVDHINVDGTIRAGCHLIPWSESERLARTLNLI
jgi:hypothetical protein